ncbi:unnamed protein product [Amoebophrya sp. A120]|nr:unnamed protein product [Amoebophrya sp. A120]|eukprot:GSA120T00006118001.1
MAPPVSQPVASTTRDSFLNAVENCTDGNVLVRAFPVLFRQAGSEQDVFLAKLKDLLKEVNFPDQAMALATNSITPRSATNSSAKLPFGAALANGGGTTTATTSGAVANGTSSATANGPSTAGTAPNSEMSAVAPAAEPPAKRAKLDMMRTLTSLSAASTKVGHQNDLLQTAAAPTNQRREHHTTSKGEGHGVPTTTSASTTTSSATNKDHNTLYVCNILYTVDEAQLQHFFETEQGCAVKFLSLYKTPAGKSKGSAKLVVGSKEEFEKCLKLNSTEQFGMKMYVRDFFAHHDNASAGSSSASTTGGVAAGAPLSTSGGATTNPGGTTTSSVLNKPSVVVKNLAFAASEANLGELFAGVGEIAAVRIARNANGKPAGFAVVEFTHEGAVQKALLKSGQNIKNRPVRVELAHGSSTSTSSVAAAVGSNIKGAPAKGKGKTGLGGKNTKGTSSASLADKLSALDSSTTAMNVDPAAARSSAVADVVEEDDKKNDTDETAGGSSGTSTVGTTAGATTAPHPADQALDLPKASLSSMFCKQAADVTWEKLVNHLVSKDKFPDEESLKSAVSDADTKSWLSAVGLKCGGTAEERVQRLCKAREFATFEDAPNTLKAPPAKIKTKKPESLPEKKK